MKKLLLCCIAVLLAGCPAIPPKAPSGPLEIIEAAEITAQQVSAQIVALTCTKFESVLGQSAKPGLGRCLEPGKVLRPSAAITYHDKVQDVRGGLKQALAIPVDGVGQCMGEKRTQAACIATARLLLNELERSLISMQAK